MQNKSCGSLACVLDAAAWSLLLVLGALSAWPQTSQNAVPPTAREAAQRPEFAQKLAQPSSSLMNEQDAKLSD